LDKMSAYYTWFILKDNFSGAWVQLSQSPLGQWKFFWEPHLARRPHVFQACSNYCL
jgi:hypothetical protein